MLIRSQSGKSIFVAKAVYLGNYRVKVDTGDKVYVAGSYFSDKAAIAAIDEIWENARLGKATDLSRAAGE